MLQDTQEKLLKLEMAIGTGVNILMTAIASWLLFLGQDFVPYVGDGTGPDLRSDLVITAFIVGVMSTFPTTLSVRSRLKKGAVEPLLKESLSPKFIALLPDHFLLRILTIALLSAFVGGLISNLLVSVLAPQGLSFASFMGAKIVFALLLAGSLTPITALRALCDKPASQPAVEA